ncbi:ABC transporter ATP-binding protein [Flavivirga abyssicola]|uniref:ABC transporter ATP-binding protein n=1 Tax=Flavivirga abyssicola TaxID=3063533 RepID=UPI0026DEED42|nr:ABC transporter ATP-binding protein [Flavivirga sp. MEBiC07777]WVK14122.1 ABC transporter ATP-binding protein [Flavivirga sp. MEBiC07777]
MLFSDLSFNQKKGSILGLLGKNAAGKSTLFNLLAGLIEPKQGVLRVNGFNPFKRNPKFLINIFLVPEEPFYPSLSINAYLKAYTPLYKNFDLKKMHQILHEFKLNEKDKLQDISHGQKKKFIIAFALSTNCKMLLLDEPTNGLDIHSKSIFRKVLVNSIDEDQLVIISTHQVQDIETIIDKIVIIENGEIVFDKGIWAISEKLQFKKMTSLLECPEALYHEKCLGGYNVISPVVGGEETNVDIELLYKAIINKTDIKI